MTEQEKVCKHCGVSKPVSEYQKAGGGKYYQPYCKPCDSARKKKYAKDNIEKVKESRKRYCAENAEALAKRKKKYYEDNKDRILEYHKQYEHENKDLISAKTKAYRFNNNEYCKARDKERRLRNHEHSLKKEKEYRERKTEEQKQRDAQKKKEWELRNRDVLNERYRERKRKNRRDYCNKKSAEDAAFRILKNLRSRIRFALKRDGANKLDTTEKMLGCGVKYFKEYFGSLFKDGMTWDAFMNGEIHIDHIKPCSKFDLTKEEEQRKCFHYTNLQPLWEADNLKKNARYDE